MRATKGQGANFSNSYLIDAVLQMADLRGANFTSAYFFGGVDSFTAVPRFANLQKANLEGANFTNADLRFADLRQANLNRANLRFANLANIILENTLQVDLKLCNTTWQDGSVYNRDC